MIIIIIIMIIIIIIMTVIMLMRLCNSSIFVITVISLQNKNKSFLRLILFFQYHLSIIPKSTDFRLFSNVPSHFLHVSLNNNHLRATKIELMAKKNYVRICFWITCRPVASVHLQAYFVAAFKFRMKSRKRLYLLPIVQHQTYFH